MKKNRIIVLFLLAATAIVLLSCQQDGFEQTGGSTAGVKVLINPVVDGFKSGIGQTNSLIPTSFKYKAEPKYVSSDPKVNQGKTESFVALAKSGSVYVPQSDFSRGEWKFTVRGYVGEVCVYEGSSTVYLNADSQTVDVNLYGFFESEKTGSVSVSVTAPLLSSSAGTFTAKVLDSSYAEFDPQKRINLTATVNTAGSYVSGTGSIDLPEGLYILEITHTDGDNATGPARTVLAVKNGMTATVTGAIENGLFAEADFSLSMLGGSIVRGNTKEAGKYRYTFVPTGIEPDECMWFINGDKVEDDESCILWDTDVSGIYYITCIAVCKNGNQILDICSDTVTESR